MVSNVMDTDRESRQNCRLVRSGVAVSRAGRIPRRIAMMQPAEKKKLAALISMTTTGLLSTITRPASGAPTAPPTWAATPVVAFASSS
jgi:hypothetical protein